MKRWCPGCRGQVYFHHRDDDGTEVWYCQSCGIPIDVLEALDEIESTEQGVKHADHD